MGVPMLVLMNRVLDSGCKCFNVLHNTIFPLITQLTQYLLLNSQLLVKVEILLVWINSLDEVTCQDQQSTKQYYKATETSLMEGHEMHKQLLTMQTFILNVTITLLSGLINNPVKPFLFSKKYRSHIGEYLSDQIGHFTTKTHTLNQLF